jgi:hypothetical protein
VSETPDPRFEADLRSILTEGERIVAVAPQNTIHSPLKKDAAVVTTRRLILHRARLLGRLEIEDFLWQDVTEVRVSLQMLGATISVTAKRVERDGQVQTRSATIEGLEKEAALRLYAEAQRFEEEWREKNRVRRMEEERARAGGVYLHGAAAAGAAPGPAQPASIEDRLAKLRELRDKGLISDAEYESRKGQIIAEL